MNRARISVIIPALDEAEHLPETLRALRGQLEPVAEILVADAGSEDGTAALAEAGGARVIACDRKGRAGQMNRGADEARGEVLWFLHADTWPHPASTRSISRALRDPNVVGGAFRRRFRSASPFLGVTCLLAGWRSRWFGLSFGDQSLFVRREPFQRAGGFAELPVFEDWDLCQKLKGEGRLVCVGPAVRSSARRFQRAGSLPVTLHDFWLSVRYLAGSSPETLAARVKERSRRRGGG